MKRTIITSARNTNKSTHVPKRSFGRRLIRCIFQQFEFDTITDLGQVNQFNCPRCGWLHTPIFAAPHRMSCQTCGKTFVLRGVVGVHREEL